MKAIVKANTVDKYLKPLRQQVVGMVRPNTTVIEFGCGTGDLLFQLSSKLTYGIGIDKSEPLVNYAVDRKIKEGITNLDFNISDLESHTTHSKQYDYSIASLLLHVMPWNSSVELLNTMLDISNTVIICEFCQPENLKQNLLLWLDQRFSGHYSHFRSYQQKNYMEGILNTIKNIEYSQHDSFDPVIKVYEITRPNSD